ncbi:XRE family transcriptional regulator [Acinetobacter radioresistens]|uniref:XRE family transcriptional regulator n=1 Tax=Acinetobacter radioresistens TaxID=40216 RepID=UPI003558544F
MSLGNRIRTLRKAHGLSQPALAKKAGVTQSTVSDLENGKKSTSADKLQSIADALKTTTTFLLTGVELPSLQRKPDLLANAKSVISEMARDEVSIKYFDDVNVSCGSGSFGEALEQEAKRIFVNATALNDRNISKDSCIALNASGDSMYPTIKDRDIVYVDLNRKTIKDGKIFAVCHGGLFKFKRLYQLPLGGVRIVSDNAAEYPEERLSAQEIIDQQFEVIGWAWSWQSLENW